MAEVNGVSWCAQVGEKIESWIFFIYRAIQIGLVLSVVLLYHRDTVRPIEFEEQVTVYTRDIEFNYLSWTLAAWNDKLGQFALAAPNYLTPAQEKDLVLDYIDQVRTVAILNSKISRIYADPAVADAAVESADLRRQRDEEEARKAQLQPLAESILQRQVTEIVREEGLVELLDNPVPVSFKVSELPMALVISPRTVIEKKLVVMLNPGLTVEKQIEIEEAVSKNLDVSALVTPIGGLALYPSMVMETWDVAWLAEVVSHEWVHHYLTVRPLGMRYLESNSLATMNETTAELAGKELSIKVLQRYYPEYVPEEVIPRPAGESSVPVFRYTKEMHTTRVRADELLAAGKVEEAEAFMEMRRKLFWENGYLIRKLNQAYFAFYGQYNDTSGGEDAGASGGDPVGPAVVKLRRTTPSLKIFLDTIGQMTSFDDLIRANTP